ncbi:MAG: Asp-tRNA(Asn)/Glu-tRNA(Gln) amidotransferase subunit GatA [Chloroflexota bacterium]
MTTDLTQLDLADLAATIQAREVSPVDVVEAYLQRIDAVDPVLNTSIRVLTDSARAEARRAENEIANTSYRGPLHGVPVGVKDLFDVAGQATTFGSPILQDNIAPTDSTVVAKLREAGAVIIAKHNLHEFAFGVTSENPHFGVVRNPWDTSRVPGGSSGGTAAAVAASLCAAGIGSDTGASVRQPGAFCGVVGFKPTYGRVSRAGALPLAPGLDHAGPIGRSVLDVALVLDAIAGYDERDPATTAVPVPGYALDVLAHRGDLQGLRVGVPREYFFDIIEPDVDAAIRAAIRTLGDLGAMVEDISLPHVAHAQIAGNVIMSSEAANFHAGWLNSRRHEYGPDVLQRIRVGLLLNATEYLQAQAMRSLIQQDFRAAFRQVDIVVSATTPHIAPHIGRTSARGGPLNLVPRSISNRLTVPCNLTGMPAISVPCGFADGLPIGLQIMGPAFDDARVLQVAAAYEAATTWQRQPPTAATGRSS